MSRTSPQSAKITKGPPRRPCGYSKPVSKRIWERILCGLCKSSWNFRNTLLKRKPQPSLCCWTRLYSAHETMTPAIGSNSLRIDAAVVFRAYKSLGHKWRLVKEHGVIHGDIEMCSVPMARPPELGTWRLAILAGDIGMAQRGCQRKYHCWLAPQYCQLSVYSPSHNQRTQTRVKTGHSGVSIMCEDQ